jgi:uncharacterized membrane protein HdeD (DUF308 family)
MSNPYQPPSFDPTQFQDQPAFPPGSAYGYSNWINQIRTFAILNSVQGILEVMFGLMASGAGIFFPLMTRMEEFKKAAAEGDGPPPEQMMWIAGGIYLTIGIFALTSGILRIVAGVQNYRLKGRMLGFVSLIVGMAPVFTCYCAPTAIALLVFGLIIYLDPAVKAAFNLVKQGRTADQVLAMFSPYQAAYPGPPQPPLNPGPPPA